MLLPLLRCQRGISSVLHTSGTRSNVSALLSAVGLSTQANICPAGNMLLCRAASDDDPAPHQGKLHVLLLEGIPFVLALLYVLQQLDLLLSSRRSACTRALAHGAVALPQSDDDVVVCCYALGWRGWK